MLKRSNDQRDFNYDKIINNSTRSANKKTLQNLSYFLALFFAYLSYNSVNLKIFYYIFFVILMIFGAYFARLFVNIKFFYQLQKIHNLNEQIGFLIVKLIVFFTIILPMSLFFKLFKRQFLLRSVDRSLNSYFVKCNTDF
jgi:hypothetical protein